MKIRNSFVSNSSSCSFIIDNKSQDAKTLVEFLVENPEIFDEYLKDQKADIEEFGFDVMGTSRSELNKENFLKSATLYDRVIMPGRNYLTFADDGGSLAECILHSMLSDIESHNKNWSWKFHESYH